MKSGEFVTSVEGMRDPKYGGIVTNVCELPVGTTFHVNNDGWTGTIKCDAQGFYIHIDGCSPKRFKYGDEEYLAIKIVNDSDDVKIIEKINHCSVCKNNNSSICKDCVIKSDSASPNNFLADCSKITPFFVDSYYEILNKYIHLLKHDGINYKIDTFDIGD